MRATSSALGQRGASAIEFAVAAPIVLLLGLGALQWALVFHARQAIEHAAIEAARAGSVGQARTDAIETGLARGLLPYWAVLPDVRAAGGDRSLAVQAARLRVRQARSAGWIAVRRLSPTRESFADWGEPALDGYGRPVSGSREIPNDNLMFAERRTPAGGAGGTHLGLPVGRASGQTLLDANLLKIEIVYGVPMTVPLVGRLAANAARLARGCLSADRGGCAIFEASDASGRNVPRWPIAAVATMRMQSPAIEPAETPSRAATERGSSSGGSATSGEGAPITGIVDAPEAFRPPGGGSTETAAAFGGVTAALDGSRTRVDSGWLSLGADRVISVPGACIGP